MADGAFKYEDCLLKHHVRTHAWLPLCKRRLKTIRHTSTGKKQRRLRYFTFCAVGAIDVLMLDVAKVICRSESRGFDNVVFFDKSPEFVLETQKSIPGAIGFPGNFVNVVLLEDLDEDDVVDATSYLSSPTDAADEYLVRERQRMLAKRHSFIQRFPFDVINLDLEQFLFQPKHDLPGKIINAFRKVFQWQQRPLINGDKLSGFSLMFTTQIGPPDITDEYLNMLHSNLQTNIDADASLKDCLTKYIGHADLNKLRSEHFEIFFKLGMPKIFASTLMEADWYVDSEKGISIFEFERPSDCGPYKILHLVMDVKRKEPPKEKRPPLTHSAVAQKAYRDVVRKIFCEDIAVVSDGNIDKASLQQNLELIKSRRKKYYPEAYAEN